MQVTHRSLSPVRTTVILLAALALALRAACTSASAPSAEKSGASSGGAATTAPSAPRTAGAQATASAQVAAPDPCTLLTREEAAAANGADLGAGQRGRGASFNQCDFREQATGRLVSVSIDRGPQSRAEFDQLRRMFAQSREDVPGLGDQAFVASTPGAIYVLKGDALLSIQIVGPSVAGGADLRSRLTSLMTKALGRL